MDINFLTENIGNPAVLIPEITRLYKSKFNQADYDAFDPAKHAVMDKFKRPDRVIHYDDGSGNCNAHGDPIKATKVEPVTRIALALQQLIVKRMVSFLTGGKVLLQGNDLSVSANQKIYEAVKSTWNKNKLQFKNGKIALAMFSETECVEIWYSVFEDKDVKLKCKVYKNTDGYTLHPIFDDMGDLIAFGLEWKTENTTTKLQEKHFDLYTANQRVRYAESGAGWVPEPPTPEYPNPLPLKYGKMPVIYYPGFYAWSIVQGIIERLEYLLSNFGDTNDYNGSPILAATGEVTSFAQKGEAGKFIEMEMGGKIEYITWQGAPEAIKLEIETLFDCVYTLTQTPNISFKEMQGLGDISGTALERLFIDAHLKASEHQQGDFGECIQRRINFLISAVIATNPNKGLEVGRNVDISPVFTPFSIGDFPEKVETAMKANGGKPVMSQRSSMEYIGYSNDIESELMDITNDSGAVSVPAQ